MGALHCPLGLHALWGLRAAGVVGGCPRGGWPATVVRGVWCHALSLPRPPVLWGRQPAFRDLCVPGAVGAGVGNQHGPHSVRPCGPALLAVGVAEGRLGGVCVMKTCHTAVLEYLFFRAKLLTRSSFDNKILQCFLKINGLEIDTQ